MVKLDLDDLKRLNEAYSHLDQFKYDANNLKDLFTDQPHLVISLSNQCLCSCLHCASDSNPQGEIMPFDCLHNVNENFFNLFSQVDFGRQGDPLTYHNQKHDLSDVIKLLYGYGIVHYTLAAGIHPEHLPIYDKLKKWSSLVTIDTMITYHHYFDEFDPLTFANNFNYCLKNYLPFSNEIHIALLGHILPNSGNNLYEEVQETFEDNFNLIFSGIKIIKENSDELQIQYKDQTKKIVINHPNHHVYPLGRFRDYLSDNEVLNEYEELFNSTGNYHVCPDLLKWPGIIVEPDGALKLCASFESLNSKKAKIINLFSKKFSEVETELLNFHQKEVLWFLTSFRDILDGKKSTCKIKEPYP